jgi:transcriptional regulator with XRE-family HTH domain
MPRQPLIIENLLDCDLNGWRLLQERDRLKMTQAELAERIGLTQQRISQIEEGNWHKIGRETAKSIRKVFPGAE